MGVFEALGLLLSECLRFFFLPYGCDFIFIIPESKACISKNRNKLMALLNTDKLYRTSFCSYAWPAQ